MRFHRRQLEIAVQCFEEVQKKPAGFFYLTKRNLLKSWGFNTKTLITNKLSPHSMGLDNHVKNLYHNTFNHKFAMISAVANGAIASGVNHAHGTYEMLAAGGTQALSSFISTGFTARIVQFFSNSK